MRKIRNTALALFLVTIVALLSGCTTFDNFRETFFPEKDVSLDTVRIGILEPQTGNDSDEGEKEIQGIQIANELYGEVLGRKIELIYADTQSSIYVAESAVQDLIDKNPIVVLGSYGDAASLAASQYLRKAEIPAIAMTASNPLITENNQYYFRVNFTDASQGRAAASFVYDKLRLRQAAVMKMKDDDATTNLVSQFKKKMIALTNDENCIPASVEIDTNVNDYEEYLEKIKASKAKTVFMAVSLNTAEKVFKQAVKSKMTDVTFIGPKDWHNDELIGLQKKYPGIKIAVSSDFSSNMKSTDLYDKFVQAYEDKYGNSEPPEATALGFDAYMIAVQSIEKAGSTDSEFVLKQLKRTADYQGASGGISFDELGEPKKTINMDIVRNDKFVSIYTVN